MWKTAELKKKLLVLFARLFSIILVFLLQAALKIKNYNGLDLNCAFHATQTTCRSHYWPTPVFVSVVVNYKRSRSRPEAALSGRLLAANPVLHQNPTGLCSSRGLSHCVMLCWVVLSSQPNCFNFSRSHWHKAASHCSPSWGTMFN